MPGVSPYFRLAHFTFGDKLDAVINVQKELDRFYIIDRQLYGLYSIFGDGIITGWEVYDAGFSEDNGIAIGVTAGQGIILSIAVETTTPSFVRSLPPNSTIKVYAHLVSNSVQGGGVDFHVDTGTLQDRVTLLAIVVTGSNGVSSIDNTVRTEIGFQQAVIDAILTHKHRGNPTKIDLVLETKNQLPGAKLEDIDASKVISGQLDPDRSPLVDHNDLINKGILTHAALDTLAQSLASNSHLSMGEITTVNFLKQLIFLKYSYPTIDTYMINELALIPGISPDKVLDYNNSTAYIANQTRGGCIVGLPVTINTTYFFTNNFELPDSVINLILTSQLSVPDNSSIIFGINTSNSVDFENDYTVITDNTLNPITPLADNIRIGVKFVYNEPIDLPGSLSFKDIVDFTFTNSTGLDSRFHFKIRFYNDHLFNDLFLTVDSSTDNDYWLINDMDSIPCEGYFIPDIFTDPITSTVDVSFYTLFTNLMINKRYYIIIDVYDVINNAVIPSINGIFVRGFPGGSGSGGGSNPPNICDQLGYLPLIKNMALMFELDNNRKIMLNT